MSDNLKSIEILENEKFIIPDFQRGYRWGKDEVKLLLDDINGFDNKNSWYCLQPLVVQNDEDFYKVIDGQQRLTTIYMILKVLGNDNFFTLTYENFEDDFFENLDSENPNDTLNQAYIRAAYNEIKIFFKDMPIQEKDLFAKKLKEDTKFIWYEVKNNANNEIEKRNNLIDVFKRLNSGKIPLEKAELVKALFLKRSNFNRCVSEAVYLKQLQIANEWDEIERKLQDDKFWYFISDKDKEDNRIDEILSIVTEKPNDEIFEYYDKCHRKLKNDFLDTEWSEIKKCFYKLEEWFNDYNLHNKIGYLQHEEKNIKILYKESKTLTRKDFETKLDNYIKDSLQKITNKNPLSSLAKNEDDKVIRKILLLHNILTVNKKREFFRFDLFKQEKNWDIEHIASAGGDAIPTKKEDREKWIAATREYAQNNLNLNESNSIITKLDNVKIDSDEFNQVFEDINNEFIPGMEKKDLNSIKNLVLLDSKTNRSYKNNIFPIKRNEIIKLDNEVNSEEIKYLLPCTKNVFLKYYSPYSIIPTEWSNEDADNYFNDIERILDLGENNE